VKIEDVALALRAAQGGYRVLSQLMLRMPDGTLHSTKVVPASADYQRRSTRLRCASPPPALAEGVAVSDILWRLYGAREPPVRLRYLRAGAYRCRAYPPRSH